MFEEDKDDSLSRLFRNSKASLEEDLPSDMVWSRIEQRLDNTPTMRIEKTPNASLWKTIRPYAAAASLVAGILTVVAIWQTSDNIQTKNPTATSTRANTPTQSDVMETSEPLAAAEADEVETVFEKEEKLQIMQLRAQKAVIVDKKENEPVEILLESKTIAAPAIEPSVATTPNAAPPVAGKSNATNADAVSENNFRATAEITTLAFSAPESNKDKISNTNANYGVAPVPQVNDIDAIVQRESAYSNTYSPQELKKRSDEPRANGLRSRSKTSTKEDAIQSKLAPRLRLFGWLVGKWEDKTRYDGYSYEEWTIKDANTLQGRGFKYKGKDRVFEERMSIFFDEKLQQVFLSMHTDDFKEPVLYMLSGINPEELTFSLDQNGTYPEKVVLQRTIDGYIVLIMNASTAFSTNQQTFLQHRNALNNFRAVRNLQPAASPTNNKGN